MISRKTTIELAEIFAFCFSKYHSNRSTGYGSNNSGYYNVDNDKLYDFVFKHDYEAWFCNLTKDIKSYSNTRPLKEFIMKIHTGETVSSATQKWTWEQRRQLGQRYIRDLSEDILNDWSILAGQYNQKEGGEMAKKLEANLALDGYIYKNSTILIPESEVINTQEESGVLSSLFTSLNLNNKAVFIHHLELSEDHYIAGRWDDSISNSRKAFECVLQEVAAMHSLRFSGVELQEKTYKTPIRVREYLEQEGLVEHKEIMTVAAVYGLLSETGNHPYIAQSDQARLLRHLSLTLSQFVMLRLQGKIVKP
jgi:hypothetical protein